MMDSHIFPYRFMVDAMFGKLGRILRILGFDTEMADVSWNDTIVLDRAMKEQRILITRDFGLFQRTQKCSLSSPNPLNLPLGLYIKSQEIEKSLAKFFEHCSLEPQNFLWESSKNASEMIQLPFLSRCSVCNAPVDPLTMKVAREKVPAGTLQHHDQFWQCSNPKCAQIYWLGRHWEDIRQLLVRTNDILKSRSLLNEKN